LLQRPGFPETVASILVAAGEGLRQMAWRTGLEHAASFDIDTGAPAGPLRAGSAHHVDLADQIAAMRLGHRYLAMHTHASSSPFSDDDLELLLRNDQIRTVIAIGANGTWYVLSKRARGATAPATVAVIAFRRALASLSPHYLAKVVAGQLTSEQALREALRIIWERIAPLLGLRYDQVDGE
jgi:hypothetical protein